MDVLDELRGFAVLGMLLVNIAVFGLPLAAFPDASLSGVYEGADRIFSGLIWLGLEGSMRAIFCLLFAIGVTMQLERNITRVGVDAAKRLHQHRMCWLILFGLVNAYALLWFGDILVLYGIVGLLLPAFRNASPLRLLILACVILVLLASQSALFGDFLSSPKNQVIPSFATDAPLVGSNADIDASIAAALQLEIEARSGGYLSAWPVAALLSLSSQLGFLWRGIWEVLAIMLIGMALYKARWHLPHAMPKTYLLISLPCLVLGCAVNAWELQTAQQRDTPALVMNLWSYDLGRLLTAFGYASLFMLLARLEFMTSLRGLFAVIGRLALTNYILQSVVCGILFVGFGLFAELRLGQLCLVALAICAFQLAFSAHWLSRFQLGPLEWLWRSLAYKEPQPLLRT